jgi:hypothetical protein
LFDRVDGGLQELFDGAVHGGGKQLVVKVSGG